MLVDVEAWLGTPSKTTTDFLGLTFSVDGFIADKAIHGFGATSSICILLPGQQRVFRFLQQIQLGLDGFVGDEASHDDLITLQCNRLLYFHWLCCQVSMIKNIFIKCINHMFLKDRKHGEEGGTR